MAVLGPPAVVARVRRSADEALAAYTALES
jgi:hypothetical protein